MSKNVGRDTILKRGTTDGRRTMRGSKGKAAAVFLLILLASAVSPLSSCALIREAGEEAPVLSDEAFIAIDERYSETLVTDMGSAMDSLNDV
ncbi:MAG: hypothetical protein LBK67_12950 [Coriobacteriales bacterium]|jgi:hypothetical protein|nr:hypothetical protein [Coriobacteriales bacterium]